MGVGGQVLRNEDDECLCIFHIDAAAAALYNSSEYSPGIYQNAHPSAPNPPTDRPVSGEPFKGVWIC